jgi:Holliday junction resolvasome RuvABC endonuclease subunit
MPGEPLKILAINPGTRYLGIAIFSGAELSNWEVKVLKSRWSKKKLERVKEILTEICDTYQPNVLAIKRLHPMRSSLNLQLLALKVRDFARKKGMKVCQYSIEEVENFFSPEDRKNKKGLAEIVASKYPELSHELEKEKRSKNPYHIRVFEAVALGAMCFSQLDK